MFAYYPATLGKMGICKLDGRGFQFRRNRVIPTIEKSEYRYLANQFHDLPVGKVLLKLVEIFVCNRIGSSRRTLRNAARSASVNNGLVSYSHAASIFSAEIPPERAA